jgi:transposase
MTSILRYLGFDVHKETIVIAVAEAGRSEAWSFKTIPNDLPRLVKAVQLLGNPDELLICYEAGPTGFGVQRALRKAGYTCQVVAPSLIPVKSGNRVKTDRRDARKLAHFLRSGDLTEITTPDEEREALRDLERARDDAKRAEHVARQHLGKFLLRRDQRYTDGSNWTQRHLGWIRSLHLEEAAAQTVLKDYLKAVEDATERVGWLTDALEALIYESSLAPLAKAMQVMRGVALVTGASIAAEIGDFRRFQTAKQFMSYVGLTPSENSSGDRVRRGAITKCGNRHVRRLLVEAAQHYRYQPNMSHALRKRNEGQSDKVRAIGWEAQKRLYKRRHALLAKGKTHNKVIIALARELAGFVWAIGQAVCQGETQ